MVFVSLGACNLVGARFFYLPVVLYFGPLNMIANMYLFRAARRNSKLGKDDIYAD